MTHIDDKRHPLEKFKYCPLCGSTHFAPSSVKSKRCKDCGFEYFFNPSAATVAIIVNDKQQILVARRGKEPAKGTMDLPGGFCDLYETSEEGLAREVKEETGLTVTDYKFLFSLPNTYPYSALTIHTIDMFYLCQIAEGETPHAMDDAAELTWLDIDKLDPAQFGLKSVRMGVEKLLGDNLL